jgi:hypothetical protein
MGNSVEGHSRTASSTYHFVMDLATDGDITCRPARAHQIGQSVGGILGGVALASLALGGHPIYQGAAVLLGLFPLTEFRRRAVVRQDHIHAQGRLRSRRIELGEVTQVGIGQRARLWVVTRNPPAGSRSRLTYLRMIWPSAENNNPSAPEVLPILRARAEKAGAVLEPSLTGPQEPDRDHGMALFSA